MQQQHTPGPWRWEVCAGEKRVKLMSDAPMRPIVMGFDRWGMNRAAPFFRNAELDIMQRVEKWLPRSDDERKYLYLPINHPDARLIAAAPTLLEALDGLVRSVYPADKAAAYAKAKVAIAKAKGTPAPIEASQAV